MSKTRSQAATPALQGNPLASRALDPSRVVVIGSTCSGKSHVGRYLADATGSPLIELDAMFWKPGWIETLDCPFRDAVRRLTEGSRWIAAGNFSVVRDILWPRATLVVWLDMSFLLTLYRGVARTLRRVVRRVPAAPGCFEEWSQFYTRDSVPWMVLSRFHSRRRLFERLVSEHAERGGTYIRVRSRKQIHDLVRTAAAAVR